MMLAFELPRLSVTQSMPRPEAPGAGGQAGESAALSPGQPEPEAPALPADGAPRTASAGAGRGAAAGQGQVMVEYLRTMQGFLDMNNELAKAALHRRNGQHGQHDKQHNEQ